MLLKAHYRESTRRKYWAATSESSRSYIQWIARFLDALASLVLTYDDDDFDTGCLKKITFKIIFELLSLGKVILGVKNYSKNFGNKKDIRLLSKILIK